MKRKVFLKIKKDHYQLAVFVRFKINRFEIKANGLINNFANRNGRLFRVILKIFVNSWFNGGRKPGPVL